MGRMSYIGLAIAAAISATTAGATDFIEVEPNDSIASAQLLVHDGSIRVTGFREAVADNIFTDFYRFSAVAGDNLTLRLNATGGGSDPVLRLLAADGTFLAEDDDAGGFPNSLINFAVLTSGDYIAAARGFGNSTYNYELLVTGITSSGAIPEPASWALMIGGIGAVGGGLRQRRKARVAFA